MNDSRHIASAFDRDLDSIHAKILKMGGLVEASIVDSSKALESRDQELAEKVRRGDAAIDALDEQINDEVANLIALRAPTAVDLRTVLAIMRMTSNLERIGDLSKNLAKRSDVLGQLTQISGATGSIRRMTREVEAMLKDALDAFIQRDPDFARDVIERDREVDEMYNTLFREFLTFMLEDPRNITACMHLHFIAKNVERMGDHVTAIAEQVLFYVTGETPEGSRPKADVTSSDMKYNPEAEPD
ncbi:phosphate signaling complex protein PhoU [Primorskyibacter flagellatus]|uniref:Phosphate-specific transport system accessory protein PhoU n=1 Tax=Primorskyibacter flagellatus TaxID=1387277 RepID=A0A1W1Z7T8_9RHOB|nr:phosphate signaling complex protein PhoU [Primorskyibacter flagellatus]SMC44211.1 phosphate uptake regulator, PhoU [Primorskyibacter flagellatus]